jgi:acyl-coenzyme A thioesterase PaaI-like protein
MDDGGQRDVDAGSSPTVATGGEFARATAIIERPSDSGGGDSRAFGAFVHEGWDIGGHANGGYLLAIAARAMAEVAGRAPLTVTAHYLAPVPAGPLTVQVATIRRGRRMATLSASLVRDDRRVLEVLGTFADQTAEPVLLCDGSPPDLLPYEQCADPVAADEPPLPALNERLAVRLRPGDDGFRFNRPSGRAEIAGWFGFADAAPIDAIALMLVADAFAPPIFNTGLAVGWVPTVELTVHIRGVPAPGRLRCVFGSRFIHAGLVEEDGEIWDSAGRLVAQSRQLALTPRV